MPKNHYRESTARFYDPDSEKYLPAYPLVWTPSKEIESAWAKQYDVEILEYADRYGLIGWNEIALLSFLRTYARAEKGIVIKPFSKQYKIGDTKLTDSIDRLQNCELLDRVRRIDNTGRPIDLILRPPRSKTELEQGHADRLLENVKINKVDLLRKELGKSFPGNDAEFSEKQIVRALGSKRYCAKEFHEFCIEKNYKACNKKSITTYKAFKDEVLSQVKYFCDKREIEYTDAVVDAALAICNHYGRRPTSFEK